MNNHKNDILKRMTMYNLLTVSMDRIDVSLEEYKDAK